MKKFLGSLVLLGCVFGLTRDASAGSFSFQFCPSAECTSDSITSAVLTFDEVLSGTDPNDYVLTATIVGGISGSYINQMEFSIGDFKYPDDYISFALATAPAGTSWLGPVDGNVPNCFNAGVGNDPCFYSNPIASGGALAGPGVTNTWTFNLNLNGTTAISSESNMNFRFAQWNATTNQQIAVFSPDGNYVNTTTTTTTDTTSTSGSNVPEPGLLLLFGAGLAAAGMRLRRTAA